MMGREVRRVPKDWEHPRDAAGTHIPMYQHFPFNQEEIEIGLREGWLTNDPPHYGCDVMPQWTEEERTHYQMYENTSEGTPISPVCSNLEELAEALASSGASWFGDITATKEQWLSAMQMGREGMVFLTSRPKENA